MTIEATIQTALNPLVAGGCWALFNTAPAPQIKPYIVYSLISDVQLNSMDGYAGMAEKRFQVDVYVGKASGAYGAVKALAASIKTAMETAIPQSLHLSSQDLYEPDTELYRITMDFSLWS